MDLEEEFLLKIHPSLNPSGPWGHDVLMNEDEENGERFLKKENQVERGKEDGKGRCDMVVKGRRMVWVLEV